MIRSAKNYANVALVSLGVTAANYILTTLFSSIVVGYLLFPTWHVVFNLLNPFFDFRILLAVLEVFAVLVTCYMVFVKPNEVKS
jgi:multisubunit Na+/H+ antiporter MnhB subunit